VAIGTADTTVTRGELRAFVAELHALINAGELETLVARCADDVTISAPGLVRTPSPAYRGHSGVREWWSAATERGALSLTAQRIEIEGSAASIVGWVTTRCDGGGLMTRARWRWVVNDGLVASLQMRSDSDSGGQPGGSDGHMTASPES
jgi:ketosteroid isomerase-like protein